MEWDLNAAISRPFEVRLGWYTTLGDLGYPYVAVYKFSIDICFNIVRFPQPYHARGRAFFASTNSKIVVSINANAAQ